MLVPVEAKRHFGVDSFCYLSVGSSDQIKVTEFM